MGKFDNIPVVETAQNKFANIPVIKTEPSKKASIFEVLKQALSDTEKNLQQTILGGLKGSGSTLAGASSVGERILQAPLKVLGMKTFEKTGAQELDLQRKLEPVGTAQKIGFGAEQIGEFLIPVGASIKVGKVLGQAVIGGRLLKGSA